MNVDVRERSTIARKGKQRAARRLISGAGQAMLHDAVQKYFNLMYDCDTSHFNEVFRSTVQLHGVRDGHMVMWPAQTYKAVLEKRQSPKSLGSPREEEILMMDFIADDLAFVKVRVRINELVFLDYLTWHCTDGQWLIASKSFFVESIDHTD
jgi:hypothetical protein